VRGVVAELGTMKPEDVTVLDMEASIEHMTRGTLRDVDILLLVTEPYFRALETLGRMAPLARELGLQSIYVVANKVRSERDQQAIDAYCARLGLELLGVVPFDETVQESDREGRALIDFQPDADAVRAIERMVERLSPTPSGIEAAAG
jgi:CO dehydrogenase maturation factor